MSNKGKYKVHVLYMYDTCASGSFLHLQWGWFGGRGLEGALDFLRVWLLALLELGCWRLKRWNGNMCSNGGAPTSAGAEYMHTCVSGHTCLSQDTSLDTRVSQDTPQDTSQDTRVSQGTTLAQ